MEFKLPRPRRAASLDNSLRFVPIRDWLSKYLALHQPLRGFLDFDRCVSECVVMSWELVGNRFITEQCNIRSVISRSIEAGPTAKCF